MVNFNAKITDCIRGKLTRNSEVNNSVILMLKRKKGEIRSMFFPQHQLKRYRDFSSRYQFTPYLHKVSH